MVNNEFRGTEDRMSRGQAIYSKKLAFLSSCPLLAKYGGFYMLEVMKKALSPPPESVIKAFTLAEVFHPLRRSRKMASRIIRDLAGVTSGSNKRAGFAFAHTAPYRKFGFTLAEVLITLGIIGVVAALTLPSLMANYRKHVYYTQFRKAATVIENAIQRYNEENGCGEVIENSGIDNLCAMNYLSNNTGDKLGSMLNVIKWITEDNYEEICNGYKKLVPAYNINGSAQDEDYYYLCTNDLQISYKNGYGFITADGMLINTALDLGQGSGSIVDVNGPNNGPNILGRDIFVFYIFQEASKRWGNYTSSNGYCNESSIEASDDCGSRLLQEGKMNY